jgi:hypothetical protein
MRLQARLFPLGDDSKRVLSSLLRPEALVFTSARCPVEVDDPVLARILRDGDSADGFWVGGEAVFSVSEARAFTHFELACRSIIKESKADFAANDAVRASTPLIDAGGHAPIRLLPAVTLTRIPLKPNMVGAVGDWTAEYVLGPVVANAFADAALAGASFRPVTNPRSGGTHDGFVHLFSDAILPPSAIDDSVERIRSRYAEEDGTLRHGGCLAYPVEALRHRPDFNRTAEPWAGGHGWPSWVVSARVSEVFHAAKLRGWHFRPVLTIESDSYAEYAAKWRRLKAAVTSTTRSTLDGGRW